MSGRRRDPFAAELWCTTKQLWYDVEAGRGCLFIEQSYCVAMSGAISLFKRLDPHVKEIIVVASGEVDTVYARDGKMWQARIRTHDGRWLVGQPCSFGDGGSR